MKLFMWTVSILIIILSISNPIYNSVVASKITDNSQTGNHYFLAFLTLFGNHYDNSLVFFSVNNTYESVSTHLGESESIIETPRSLRLTRNLYPYYRVRERNKRRKSTYINDEQNLQIKKITTLYLSKEKYPTELSTTKNGKHFGNLCSNKADTDSDNISSSSFPSLSSREKKKTRINKDNEKEKYFEREKIYECINKNKSNIRGISKVDTTWLKELSLSSNWKKKKRDIINDNILKNKNIIYYNMRKSEKEEFIENKTGTFEEIESLNQSSQYEITEHIPTSTVMNAQNFSHNIDSKENFRHHVEINEKKYKNPKKDEDASGGDDDDDNRGIERLIFGSTAWKSCFDKALLHAFLPILYLPLPKPALTNIYKAASAIDVAGRKRLDRRTLYQSLLLELTLPNLALSDEIMTDSIDKEEVNTLRNHRKLPLSLKRRYLDQLIGRALRGALCLASQPRWRRHIAMSSSHNKDNTKKTINESLNNNTRISLNGEEVNQRWWRGGLRLYSTNDEDIDLSSPSISSSSSEWQVKSPRMMGIWGVTSSSAEEGEESTVNIDRSEDEVSSYPPTLAMQETVAMALAHSLNCGLVLIDDVSLNNVRNTFLRGSAATRLGLTSDSFALRPASILGHLIRITNEGIPLSSYKLNRNGTENNWIYRKSGRISMRMKMDLALGLDDPHDEFAVESLRLMQRDEKSWYEPEPIDDTNRTVDNFNKNRKIGNDDDKKPLTLVLFLRTEASTSLLRSKSAVEILARECVNDDSIHLLMLGKGIDSTTVSLPAYGAQRQGSTCTHSYGDQNQVLSFSAMSRSEGKKSFTKLSNIPPGMISSLIGNSMNVNSPFGSTQRKISASGVEYPKGSHRFNIFLARAVDKDGLPGIMGAIAPPQTGNLFPQMLAFQMRENIMRYKREINPDGVTKQDAIIERWAELMDQHSKVNGNYTSGLSLPPSHFYNSSIISPFINGNNNISEGIISPPYELIQHAITDVIHRLMKMNCELDAKEKSNSILPPHVSKLFTHILSNEVLRRDIYENVSRAAPALADPRCQGVMLSVYAPPLFEYPKCVSMSKQSQKYHDMKEEKSNEFNDNFYGKNKDSSTHVMSDWLNKILLSSSSSLEKEEYERRENSTETELISKQNKVVANNLTYVKHNVSKESTSSEENSVDVIFDTGSLENTEKPEKQKFNSQVPTSIVRKNEKFLRSKLYRDSLSSCVSSLKKPKQEITVRKNFECLQMLCRSVVIKTPLDPVRSRSWNAWVTREQGSVVFKKNRRALNIVLAEKCLQLRVKTGTNGVGSVLRQMMSIRDISLEMDEVVKSAVEMEAAKSQRLQESPWKSLKSNEFSYLAKDPSLEQIVVADIFSSDRHKSNDSEKYYNPLSANELVKRKKNIIIQYIHPKSIESALSIICRICPLPLGALLNNATPITRASHRTHDEFMALAQDKHERALVSQVVSPQDIGVSYDMIGGLAEVKELLRQSITYPLKFPHLYSEGIAREAVKGVLLFGPPGTGKTMLAKAVATEGGATFLSVDASSVENKWLGESEKNAKAVFTLARRLAPCVIFIDEVDSILSRREGNSDDSTHGALTSVKTTMMSEWDGLNSGTNGKGEAGLDRVVVIGSTNRPFDLDEAVLRRFPRRILVDLPDMETRREILDVTLAENRLDVSVNLTAIAQRLEGYTGSDIKEVCREAVVKISHDQARLLDQGYNIDEVAHEMGGNLALSSTEGVLNSVESRGLQRLRPVTMEDFESAMKKLKKSVSEKGRELAKVWEWNDEYGEMKKKDKKDYIPQLMNMFL